MALDRAQVFGQSSGAGELTAAGIVDRLSRFDGPPEEFLVNLLAVQCQLASAEAGVILRAGGQKGAELLAVYPQLPPDSTAPVWMAQAVESAGKVMAGGATAIIPLHEPDALYGQAAKRHLIMLPIASAGNARGLAAFLVASSDAAVLAQSRERLELSSSLLSLYEMRLTLQRRQYDLQRLRVAMETLSAVNEHDRATGASMAFCNELASRWQCDRVALGFLRGRYVKLKALSHTEKIIRKMKLVQDIEAAMEECLDQDVEILSPAPKEATYVSRATDELSRLHGPMNVVSLPLRRAGEVVAVVTVERDQERPFVLEEIESLRLTCDLCTARLVNLDRTDRWFGARAAGSGKKALAVLVGAKHTWAKVTVLLVFLGLAYMFLAKGDYLANATFVIESRQHRYIPAPFDGYIEAVNVEPGDKAIAGQTVLAKLETVELEGELARLRADYTTAQNQAASALDGRKMAEYRIAKAQAAKAKAQIDLLERKIREASIISPIDGTIVSPDLTRRVRGHVGIGEVMFEVAPIDALRAELAVPEDQIADVLIAFEAARRDGRELGGELATEGKPEKRVKFVVERITPVAEVLEKENVFKVRARLLETHGGMLPGAKGVARINVGRRRYAFLWTRKLVNWLRMKLWL